ncbi:MAG: hypothetical protein DRP06_01090 [Candidatus Aenigmatarchaeota archaeon]|nr:MAG: hypothetical protein DRP06_01090 [Candidatus Aenigmarchaeota archaeon]
MDTKQIKEFFKPTKIKIRITLFLTIMFLLWIHFTLYFISPGRCDTYISTFLHESIFYLLGLFLKSIPLFFNSLNEGIIILAIEMIFGFFLFLILLYSFSCLFDFLYNSFGKSKHNKILRFILIIITLAIIAFPISIENCRLDTSTEDFYEKCEDYCGDATSLEYCNYYFEGPYWRSDWNDNGIKNELIEIGGDMKYNVCEDRIYCFHIAPCKQFGENPIENCAKVLCEAGYTKYENISLASRYVLNEYNIKPGNCSLPDNNWHSLYFPKNVCEKYINID